MSHETMNGDSHGDVAAASGTSLMSIRDIHHGMGDVETDIV